MNDKALLERPSIDHIATLNRFKFGPKDILGSRINDTTLATLRKKLGARGAQLAENLVSYHPGPNGYGLTLAVMNETNPAEAWLQATAYTGGWSDPAKILFSSLQFIPSPTGLPFLVPKRLGKPDDPTTIDGEWILSYAKIEGGPNPYAPDSHEGVTDLKDPRARKVILVWSLEDFDEYVYTCWAWG